MGHTPLGWLVDPDDWMLPGADTIASRIEQQLTPRAVVLVHDGGGDRRQTIDALKQLIPKLLSQGWTFDRPEVTIEAHPLPSGSPSASASASTTPSPSPSASSSVQPSTDPGREAGSGPNAGPTGSGSSAPDLSDSTP
jgi:hypothetical protein